MNLETHWRALPVLQMTTLPWLTGSVLLLSDLLAVILAGLLGVWARYLYDQSLIWEWYLSLWPGFLMFPFAYALVGLYPGVGITAPEELRRQTVATSLVFLLAGVSTFMYKSGSDYSRGAFVFAWIITLIVVPLVRGLTRELMARKRWWGTGVAILGAGQTGIDLVKTLRRQAGLGLKPLVFLDDDSSKLGKEIEGVPVLGELSLAPRLVKELGISHAIIAMPSVPRRRLLEIFENYGAVFPHLMLIPDLFGLSSLWVSARDLGGVLGLEIRQRLLMPLPKFIKRLIDLGLVILAAPLILTVSAMVALLVKLSSPGPALFKQTRPGRYGRQFEIYKFRTMYTDAEERFGRLSEDLRKEFEMFGKIQDDPRVTPIGYWLRKLSLDEFPQFWNVLKGEMSLVGPRAYLLSQLGQIKGYEHLILSVAPGLSGLWQVSGRSEVTLKERLEMDSYYVRNWSPWLDLYILARTVWVVLFSRGAY